MRQSTLHVIGLAAICLAPIVFVVAPSFHGVTDLARHALSRATTAAPAPVPQQGSPAQSRPTASAENKPGFASAVVAVLQEAVAKIETAVPDEPPTHEPRLSIYATPAACGEDGQNSPMCRAAYRDARLQSERSSDIFEDLDACEHRYGERSCYERRLKTGFTIGESLYMPIMAGFAMVTDGQHMVSRPVYRCPGRHGLGEGCHQTETGIVIRERRNNRPVTLNQFEQDYTGYMLRQTTRETTIEDGRAFVFVRTAAITQPQEPREPTRAR